MLVINIILGLVLFSAVAGLLTWSVITSRHGQPVHARARLARTPARARQLRKAGLRVVTA